MACVGASKATIVVVVVVVVLPLSPSAVSISIGTMGCTAWVVAGRTTSVMDGRPSRGAAERKADSSGEAVEDPTTPTAFPVPPPPRGGRRALSLLAQREEGVVGGEVWPFPPHCGMEVSLGCGGIISGLRRGR